MNRLFSRLTFFRPQQRLPRIGWITEELAISGEPSDSEWPAIYDAGIRCVVDLRAEQPTNAAIVRAAGLDYLYSPIIEGQAPSVQQMEALTETILDRMQARRPVLVHCREGRGRSATIVAAVLVRLGLPVFEAYRQLTRARPEAVLNERQVESITRFAASQGATASTSGDM